MAKPKRTDNSKEILDSLKQLDRASIRWGARGKNNQDKLVSNEFGTKRIPERPAMRITYGSSQTHAQISKAARVAITRIIEGKKPDDALILVGQVGLAELRKTFRSSVPPENAESTIKRKGPGKNTLFDTGELFRSLGFDIIL